MEHSRQSGYKAVQVFISAPQRMDVVIPSLDVQRLRELTKEVKLYFHTSYLLNLAVDPAQRNGKFLQAAALRNLNDTIAYAEQVGAAGVVTHVGSTKSEIAESLAVSNVVSLIQKLCPFSVPLLLEVDPGSRGNSKIGSIENISTIIEAVSCAPVGMCLDTCHAYVRGYDLNSPLVLGHLLKNEFLTYIKLVHLNGCEPKGYLGSNLDRHSKTPLAESSHLSPSTLSIIARHCIEESIPMILERDVPEVVEQDSEFLKEL